MRESIFFLFFLLTRTISLNSEDDWLFDYVCLEPEVSAEEEGHIENDEVRVESPEPAPIDLPILRRIDTNIMQMTANINGKLTWISISVLN